VVSGQFFDEPTAGGNARAYDGSRVSGISDINALSLYEAGDCCRSRKGDIDFTPYQVFKKSFVCLMQSFFWAFDLGVF
jgi:hypothetical protein